MSALNFRKEFASMVESGMKKQTIRRTRKDIYKGKALQLFTGQRTKSCRKLVEFDPVCKKKEPIAIYERGGSVYIVLNGKLLSCKQESELARADGFACRADFIEFFEKGYGLPFGDDGRGAEVIYW